MAKYNRKLLVEDLKFLFKDEGFSLKNIEELIDVTEKAYDKYNHDFRYVESCVYYFLSDMGINDEQFSHSISEIIEDYFVGLK